MMKLIKIYRRTFLASIGITAASGMLGGMVSCGRESQHIDQSELENQVPEKDMQSKIDFWEDVRAQFELDTEVIHMAGLLLMNARQVVESLHQRNVVASDTPYSPSYARLTPGIYNTTEEMEETLRAVNDLS